MVFCIIYYNIPLNNEHNSHPQMSINWPLVCSWVVLFTTVDKRYVMTSLSLSFHRLYINLFSICRDINKKRGSSWSWSYGRWIYNYLCNQYLSPLTLWFRIPLRPGVLDTTLCDKVCQWFAAGWWLSPGTPVFPPIKLTATILLKHFWEWR